MLSPLKFIKVSGFTSITFCPLMIPCPVMARFLIFLTEIWYFSAIASIISNPILCLVLSYSLLGFPSPAIRNISFSSHLSIISAIIAYFFSKIEYRMAGRKISFPVPMPARTKKEVAALRQPLKSFQLTFIKISSLAKRDCVCCSTPALLPHPHTSPE